MLHIYLEQFSKNYTLYDSTTLQISNNTQLGNNKFQHLVTVTAGLDNSLPFLFLTFKELIRAKSPTFTVKNN